MIKNNLRLTARIFLIAGMILLNGYGLYAQSAPENTDQQSACGDPSASLSSQPGIDPKVAELRRKFETSRKCE